MRQASQARNAYEEQVKTALVRRIFHLAIANPMHEIENVWRAYDRFENGLNKQLVPCDARPQRLTGAPRPAPAPPPPPALS